MAVIVTLIDQQKLWQLKIRDRLNMFLWRVELGLLPTRDNLVQEARTWW